MDLNSFKWTREPLNYSISDGKVEIITKPHTDLWQRTYYHFRNDNAPVFQMETEEQYFSFVVKTEFTDSHQRFDQCGVVLYLDSENWLKGSIEYENESSVSSEAWKRKNPLWHLCMLTGRFLLQGRLYEYGHHGMHVEGTQRTAAG